MLKAPVEFAGKFQTVVLYGNNPAFRRGLDDEDEIFMAMFNANCVFIWMARSRLGSGENPRPLTPDENWRGTQTLII